MKLGSYTFSLTNTMRLPTSLRRSEDSDGVWMELTMWEGPHNEIIWPEPSTRAVAEALGRVCDGLIEARVGEGEDFLKLTRYGDVIEGESFGDWESTGRPVRGTVAQWRELLADLRRLSARIPAPTETSTLAAQLGRSRT